MKKIKILVASVLCCAMGYAGYTAYEKMTMSEAEKFMIANVEALTSNENGEESINPYYEAGYFYCRCKNNSDGVKGCYGGECHFIETQLL